MKRTENRRELEVMLLQVVKDAISLPGGQETKLFGYGQYLKDALIASNDDGYIADRTLRLLTNEFAYLQPSEEELVKSLSCFDVDFNEILRRIGKPNLTDKEIDILDDKVKNAVLEPKLSDKQFNDLVKCYRLILEHYNSLRDILDLGLTIKLLEEELSMEHAPSHTAG
ncbi:hypothetical protein [Aquibacillus sediminis]|uniref:hypothetical protein n=1 Tax=Aquibacillus sediminis TaxID=2574734 RepID=UPI001107DA62|nr:hypothetical protein [Aquibacillus sediminis]